MISAQAFRVIAAFHSGVWMLFFIGAAVWLLFTWRGWQHARFLCASFVRTTEAVLLLSGFLMWYAYEFAAFYAVKGAIAILMLYFYEKTRLAIKRQQYRQLYPHGVLLVVTAVVVWAMGVYWK